MSQIDRKSNLGPIADAFLRIIIHGLPRMLLVLIIELYRETRQRRYITKDRRVRQIFFILFVLNSAIERMRIAQTEKF